MAVPGYGSGEPIKSRELRDLVSFAKLEVHHAPIKVPAILTPPYGGSHHLMLREDVGPDVARYIQLHEVGHIQTGDADEPTILTFAGPLPEAEEVADLFALVGILDDVDCQLGEDWVEERIRDLVPLEDRGWQVHRIPRLAPKVIRMKQLVKEWLDG